MCVVITKTKESQMSKDARKFRNYIPVTNLNDLPNKTNVRTGDDRIKEFIENIECVRKFNDKLIQVMKSGEAERIEKCKKNLSGWVVSARDACARLIDKGIDPKQVVREYMQNRQK